MLIYYISILGIYINGTLVSILDYHLSQFKVIILKASTFIYFSKIDIYDIRFANANICQSGHLQSHKWT